MEQEKKPVSPYKSMTSHCEDGKLHLLLEATDPEESIRFAYGLHVSLLPVCHTISVKYAGDYIVIFQVNSPSHGK